MRKHLFQLIILIMVASVIFSLTNIVIAKKGNENLVWISAEDSNINYQGMWMSIENKNAIDNEEYSTFRKSSTVEYKFEGTGIRWIGSTGPNRGKANVYIDGKLVSENLDTYSEKSKFQQIIFEKVGLKEGSHVLKIDPLNKKRDKASMASVNIDNFQYQTTNNLKFNGKKAGLKVDFENVEINEEKMMIGPLNLGKKFSDIDSIELTNDPDEVISGDTSLKLFLPSLPDTSGNPWVPSLQLLLVPDNFPEGTNKFKYSFDIRILEKGEAYNVRGRIREGNFEKNGGFNKSEHPIYEDISGVGVHHLSGIGETELSSPLKAQIVFRVKERENETEKRIPFVIDNLVIEKVNN